MMRPSVLCLTAVLTFACSAAVAPAAVVSAQAEENAEVAGRYRNTRGKPGSGFLFDVTVVLKADQTAEWRTVSEFQGRRNAKTATGSWTADGDRVSVHLDKSSDGKEIPESERDFQFKRTAEGDLVMERKGEAVVFKRVKEEPSKLPF